MWKIILGISLVGVGTLMIIKTEWLINNFGTNAWAEAKLGYSGGTRLFYKLLGLLIILVGLLLVTGMWEGFLFGTVGRIFAPTGGF